MKKILSVLAGIAVVGVSLMNAVGCKDFGKKGATTTIGGTNGAKIALARERLDESVFSEKMSFWESGETAQAEAQPVVKRTSASNLRATQQRRDIRPISSGGVTVENGKTLWTEFGSGSLTMENYANVFKEVEYDASLVATTIGEIKKNVGVTDKWIGGTYLLHVEDDREILLEKHHFENESTTGYQVATRYTREDAKNIYDIYSAWTETGQSGELRMKYIPGEYYESSYVHSNGFTDFFVAENSSGYWKLNRFSYSEGYEEWGGNYRNASVESYVLKDGLGIGTIHSVSENEELGEYGSVTYDLFDTVAGQDLFKVHERNDGTYAVATYFGNVKSGLIGVQAPNENVYIDGEVRTGSHGCELVFADGSTDGEERGDGFTIGHADVYYDYMKEHYLGGVTFETDASSLAEGLADMDEYWASKGVTLKASASSLAESFEYAAKVNETIEETFVWNGEKAATLDGAKAGKQALLAFFEENSEIYEELKDLEEIEYSQEEIVVGSFAAVDALTAEKSSYENGKITLTNASATIANNEFLEAGKEYVLKVGLALKTKEGLQSVNTVALEIENERKTAFAEGAETLTVTQSGEYELPSNLSEGNYVAVVYVATADEGIRVSELKEIPFGEVTEGAIPSAAMKIDVKKSGESLTAHYGVQLGVWTELPEKESYTAEDVERALTRAVMSYGYPKAEEVVTMENGEPIAADTPIAAGTYKLKFYMSTEDGMAEAYAYVTVE